MTCWRVRKYPFHFFRTSLSPVRDSILLHSFCSISCGRNADLYIPLPKNTCMPLKSILTVSLFLFCLKGITQPLEDGEYNRIVKINLASLLAKNVSGQYEMILSQKVSVALGFRYAPYVGLPFKHLLAKINNENADVTSILTKTS